jgi:hypothetical protein
MNDHTLSNVFFISLDWLSLLFKSATSGLLVTAADEFRAVIGMRIGKEDLSTRRKPALVPLSPPKNARDLT